MARRNSNRSRSHWCAGRRPRRSSPGNVHRVGYLSARGAVSLPRSYSEGFRQGLRDLGYIEGKNILIEFRYAEGKLDRFPSLVAELVQLKVDVLVSTETAAIRAGKAGNQDNPHCFCDNSGPGGGWLCR